MSDLHWEFTSDAGSLWTTGYIITALTRAAAAALISQGEAESSTDWLPGDAFFHTTDRFARKQAASGVNTSATKQSVRMSQIDGRLALHRRSIVDDALSRYKQEFTASVKLHTS
jgi:hypothetical protein